MGWNHNAPFWFSAVLGAAIIAMSVSALANHVDNCGPRLEVLFWLLEKFGEVPVASGLSIRGYLLEVTASPIGGWSVLLSTPDGMTCLVDEGEAWKSVSPASPSLLEREVK